LERIVLNICRRNFRLLALALLLAWSIGPNAQAQTAEASKKTLTLDEAVDFALKHYPAVRASLERSTAAQAGVGLARTTYLPRADTVWQTNRATDNNITGLLLPQSVIAPISGPVPATASGRSAWGSAAGLLFSWEPLDFGYRGAKVDAVLAVRDQAAAETCLTRLDVAVATVNAYLTVLAAERTVHAAEADLNVYAPFDGIVTTRNLHPGALVGPASGPSGTMPIVQIVDMDHLRLIVVPEAYVGEMQLGQQVAFTVPGLPGETFHAPIARISHDVELSTRTMPIELDVHNADGRLSPGSFSSVQWPVHRATATMFVPTTAVTNDQQRTFVERVRDGKVEWVDVVTGLNVSGNIEIFGDLKPGDKVIRNATDAIRAGQQVKTSSAHS
jgi:RND family efflux transporter MFP subunit